MYNDCPEKQKIQELGGNCVLHCSSEQQGPYYPIKLILAAKSGLEI